MSLAVSNLAWEISEDLKVFEELKKLGINQIEGVLTKLGSWSKINDDVIHNFKSHLTENELEIKSIQSIFYGVDISTLDDTKKVINHIENLLRYSKILDLNLMVLGSPSLRVLNDYSYGQLKKTLTEIDNVLMGSDVEISIEPNARIYGGQYFFRLGEIIEFLNQCKFTNIKTMIDTHNLIMEGDDPCILFREYSKHINHIHISEPNLSALFNFELHNKFSEVLRDMSYDKTITLEMKNNGNIIESVKNFSLIYK
jgi:sugar phosphate isomerase/epimerase